MKDMDNLFGFEIKTEDIPKLILKTSNTEESDQLRRYSFNVDLSNLTGKVIDIKAVFMQGDRESSVINANIIQNGRPFNLNGYTVSINIKENSNELETYICEIEDATRGIVKIALPAKYVDEAGICMFELCLQKNNRILLSQTYSYTVLQSLGEGKLGTETQMTALQQLIQQVQNQHTELQNITTELEVTQSDIDDIMNMVGGL